MSEQGVIDFNAPRARLNDHPTSIEGAQAVTVRAGSQRYRLLVEYSRSLSLTDEEAAIEAGLSRTCYWKRCGELRAGGFIRQVVEATGRPATARGDAGVQRILCEITPAGVTALQGAQEADR